ASCRASEVSRRTLDRHATLRHESSKVGEKTGARLTRNAEWLYVTSDRLSSAKPRFCGLREPSRRRVSAESTRDVDRSRYAAAFCASCAIAFSSAGSVVGGG